MKWLIASRYLQKVTLSVYTLCLLVLLGFASVHAEDTVATETPISVEQWDIFNLPSDWWRSFQVADNVVLSQKLTALQTKLQAVNAAASQEQAQTIANISDALALNIKAYVDLKAKNNKIDIKPAQVQDSYPLGAWIEALQVMRNFQHDKVEQTSALDQISNQLAAISREADDAAAQYHVATRETRVLPVLVMLERRFAWFVANESMRLQKQRLDNVQAQLEQATIAWQLSTQALQITDKVIKQTITQRDSDKQLLEKRSDALRSAQASAVLVWGEDELSRAKGQLQQVRALNAAIELLTTKIALQWDERLVAYLRARQDPKFDWDTDLRGLLPTWQLDAQAFDEQRKQLRGQLEAKREQIQSALLQLADNTPADVVKQLAIIKQTYQQALQLLSTDQTALKSASAQLSDNETLSALQDKLLLAHDGVWHNRWHAATQVVATAFNDVASLLTATLFKVGDTPVTSLGIIRVIVFITIAWWVSYWLRKALIGVAARNDKIARHTAYTLGRLIHYVIMIIGTVVALSSVGIDFSNLAWIAGALSVGIGFGLQDVVKNFVAGLIVMFEKTLKVGDFIELPSGISGTVKEISLRSTLITTGDNLEVVIPNGEFTSGRVVNWTLSDLYRRVHIPFNVALASDKRVVVDAVLAAANQVPYTIKEEKRQPQVVLGSLDGKMAFELLVWIKQGSVQHAYGVKASYLWQIETALREKGIELV